MVWLLNEFQNSNGEIAIAQKKDIFDSWVIRLLQYR